MTDDRDGDKDGERDSIYAKSPNMANGIFSTTICTLAKSKAMSFLTYVAPCQQ
jgi:hypothetical protein